MREIVGGRWGLGGRACRGHGKNMTEIIIKIMRDRHHKKHKKRTKIKKHRKEPKQKGTIAP